MGSDDGRSRRRRKRRRSSSSCSSDSSIDERCAYCRHKQRSYMEKPARYKAKNKKSSSPKQKTTKKKKTDGPTCSMFLSELTKKLAVKRRQDEEAPRKRSEEEPRNVVQTIVDSITNALPFKFSKKIPEKKESPMKIETLQTYAPELVPNNVLEIPHQPKEETIEPEEKQNFKMPRMPVVSSEVLKIAAEKNRRSLLKDASVNTTVERDMASELVKHVGTLKRISLIAEEFNQKTAKNLKEIVDSVQEDLVKKLEEIREEQKLQQQAQQLKEELEQQKE